MYIVSTRWLYRRPLTEAEQERGQADVVDGVLARAPGFRAYYYGPISDTEALAVSVWESEADWKRALEQQNAVLPRVAGEAIAGEPQRTAVQVTVQRVR